MKKYVGFWLLVVLFTISCKQKNENSGNPSGLGSENSVELLKNPAELQSHLPRLFSNGKQLYMSWVTQKKDTSYLNFSVFENDKWSKAKTITVGTDWFINWADFPVISENNGSILTTYLQKSDTATYAYDIKFNIYDPKTATWKKDLLLHDDGTKTEHGFVSAVPGPGGFEVAWLDGRNTVGGHNGHNSHSEGGAMSLRTAIITSVGEIINEAELDDKVCDCCQTSIASSGRITRVAYRDRSEEEVRDISVAGKAISGHLEKSIQTVYNDNWKIAGCPVNGPSVDAFDTSFGIAWFTAADGEGKVKAKFWQSENSAPIRVDNGNATGRVDIAMISKTEAVVLWMEPKGDNEVIMLAKINRNGKKISELPVTETSPERASGFPQLEVMEGNAYVAWTDVDGENKKINTATVDLKDF